MNNPNWILYPPNIPSIYIENGIRGNNANDIMIACVDGEIDHWNGNSWYRYENFINTANGFARIDIKGNLSVAVGTSRNDIYRNAIVAIGKR